MNRVYEFAMRLNDLVSPTLIRMSAKYSSTVSGMERVTNRIQSSFARAGQSVDQLRRKLTFGKETQSISALKVKLDTLTKHRDLMVDTGQIKRANREVDVLQKKLDKLQGKDGKESGGLLSRLAPYVGVAGLLAGAGSLLSSGMGREQTEVAFEQLVGKQGVAPLMTNLNRFADVTPYDNEQVYGAGRKLLSAKVDPQHLTATMTQIGNMAAVTQKDFGELSASYAKIKQKGFMDSGELHMEFGGTAVMDQLKKDLGVNGEDLFKMAEKRQIRFADLQTAIENLSEQGGLYEGGLDKLSKTAGGKWSTFIGTLQNKLTSFVAKLNPLLGQIFDFGSGLLTKIDPLLAKLEPVFTTVMEGVGKVWDAMAPLGTLFGEVAAFAGRLWEKLVGLAGGADGLKLVFDLLAAAVSVVSTLLQWTGELVMWLIEGPLGTLVIAIAGLTTAWWAFNAVVALNPFTFWISVLAAVVVGIKYCWDNVEGFRNTIIRCWETLKSMFSAVGPILKAMVLPTPENIAAAYSAVKASFATGLANGDKAIAASDKARAVSANMPKVPAKPAPNKPDMPGGKGKDGVGKAAGLDATTGGTKSTTITINIKSLVERLNINASNVGEGVKDMEGQVTDVLLRVLNSANSMQTQ